MEPSCAPWKASRVLLNTSFNRLYAVTAKHGLVSLDKHLPSIWSTVPAVVDQWPSLAPCKCTCRHACNRVSEKAAIRGGGQTP